jgi:cytochrome c oxidase subunit 4
VPVALEQRETVDPAGHAAAESHGRAHPSPKEYVRIGIILAVLTGLEIAASYAGVSGGILIPTLLILAIIKFAMVVLWYMHLKFDDRRFARFFVMGLSGAAILYLVVLISFKVFL